jgi:hypothetical protein
MQTSLQEASFGHRGQPMLQVTFRPVPPTKHYGSLGSGLACFWVPPRETGQKENRICIAIAQ